MLANQNSKFVHIIHNLDDDYQGRIFIGPGENYWDYIAVTGLPADMLIDPLWQRKIINYGEKRSFRRSSAFLISRVMSWMALISVAC